MFSTFQIFKLFFTQVLLSLQKVIYVILQSCLSETKFNNWYDCIHTYYSSFISKGVAKTSQAFLLYQNSLALRNTADVTGGKSIASSFASLRHSHSYRNSSRVWVLIILSWPFTTSLDESKGCYCFFGYLGYHMKYLR
jgi:hypothetical protein